MDRRAFIGTIAGGLLAAPLAVEAQQTAKIDRIGYLATNLADSPHWRDAFLQGLRDLGYVDDPVPERPKGMHRRTYERMCNEAEKAQLPYQDRLLKGLPGLLARLGALPQTETDHPDEDQLVKAVQRVLESPEPLKQTKRAPIRGRTKNSRPPRAPRRRGAQ